MASFGRHTPCRSGYCTVGAIRLRILMITSILIDNGLIDDGIPL